MARLVPPEAVPLRPPPVVEVVADGNTSGGGSAAAPSPPPPIVAVPAGGGDAAPGGGGAAAAPPPIVVVPAGDGGDAAPGGDSAPPPPPDAVVVTPNPVKAVAFASRDDTAPPATVWDDAPGDGAADKGAAGAGADGAPRGPSRLKLARFSSKSIRMLVEPEFKDPDARRRWTQIGQARRAVLPHTMDVDGNLHMLPCCVPTGRYCCRCCARVDPFGEGVESGAWLWRRQGGGEAKAHRDFAWSAMTTCMTTSARRPFISPVLHHPALLPQACPRTAPP